MKTINCWDDLSQYGIVPLTGEACGLSYRILCDVTAAGKRIIEKALDVAQLGSAQNWNTGKAEDRHVGCIMLAPEILSLGSSPCWSTAVVKSGELKAMAWLALRQRTCPTGLKLSSGSTPMTWSGELPMPHRRRPESARHVRPSTLSQKD